MEPATADYKSYSDMQWYWPIAVSGVQRRRTGKILRPQVTDGSDLRASGSTTTVAGGSTTSLPS